jgi:hypothetical protein
MKAITLRTCYQRQGFKSRNSQKLSQQPLQSPGNNRNLQLDEIGHNGGLDWCWRCYSVPDEIGEGGKVLVEVVLSIMVTST